MLTESSKYLLFCPLRTILPSIGPYISLSLTMSLLGSCILKLYSSLATSIHLGTGLRPLGDEHRTRLSGEPWLVQSAHWTYSQPVNLSLWLLNLETKIRSPVLSELGNVKYPCFCSVLLSSPRRESNMQKTAKGETEVNLPEPGVTVDWGSAVLALILLVHPSPFLPKLVQVWSATIRQLIHWTMTTVMQIRQRCLLESF